MFDSWAPVCPTLTDAGTLAAARSFRVRLVTESKTAFDVLCWLAYEKIGNCTLAIDEIHEYVPSHHAAIPYWFRKCVLRGRHKNISIIGSSQRTANVHNDFLFAAAAHRVYVFRTPVEDLGGLKRYKSLHAASLLPVGQYLTYPPIDHKDSNGINHAGRGAGRGNAGALVL